MLRGPLARAARPGVNTVEFFVTLAASIAFVLSMGLSHWTMILGLGVGGVIA